MTQLDVPNISFTHYLDLLKRRTWHVIITSVLGLVVGGIVAMLIPRLYVCTTKVELSRPILDARQGFPEDPMSQLVNAAMVRVPEGAHKAIKELRWNEGLTGSEEERITFAANLRRRIGVYDMGPPNKSRRFAIVMISYRDVDGERAKEMTAKLRDLWLSDFVKGQTEQAQAELQAALTAWQAKVQEVIKAQNKVRAYEEQHGISPLDWADERTRGQLSVLSTNILLMKKDIADKGREAKGLESQIGAYKKDLRRMSPTVAVDVQDLMKSPELREAYTMIVLRVLRATKALKTVGVLHPDYQTHKTTLATAMSEKAELERVAGGQAPEKPNPDYKKLEDLIRSLEIDKVVKLGDVVELELQLEAMERQSGELPGIYEEYEKLRSVVRGFEKEASSLAEDLQAKRVAMSGIKLDQGYEIRTEPRVPPAPTEPNPFLVALIGCAVGLGFAVVLVLLIDFLQLSFKSVSDVETSLGLPVLGTMTYLETQREIASTRGRRARMTVAGVSFLGLVLTIVTIYYVNSTLLPTVVANLLEQILGPNR